MATYGKIRNTKILGQAGNTWYVQLWKKSYTGATTSMTLEGEGFTVKWNGQGGTRNRRFIESECITNFMVQSNSDEALLYDIFESGDRNYFIRVYKNEERKDNLWWYGWVNPSFSTVENTPFPYKSTISATDSIGTFKKKAESTLTSSQHNSTSTMNEHIKSFGSEMNLFQDWSANYVSNGNFSGLSPWVLDSTNWSYPSGGGQINCSGSTGYMSQDNVSITQGETTSIMFTLKNIDESGSPVELVFRNENGDNLIGNTVSYTLNGDYVVSGLALVDATGIRVQSLLSAPFSMNGVVLVKVEVNTSPAPIRIAWFSTSIDWWRNGDTYQSDDPFYLYRIGRAPFIKSPSEFPDNYSKYDVLDGGLKVFNTVGFMSDGRYNFIQPNQYQENTSGDLRFYQYATGGSRDEYPTNENFLLELDGTINANKGAVMEGSNLVYEPPLGNVSATFLNSAPTINIPSTTDFSTLTFVGNLQADPSNTTGSLSLYFKMWHQESLLVSEVQPELSSGFDLANKTITTDITFQVKLTDGVSSYWLKQNTSAPWYSWENTEQSIQKSAGHQTNNPNPNSTGADISQYPCSIIQNSWDSYYYARTEIILATSPHVPLPPITGSVYLKLEGVNSYREWKPSDGSVGTYYGTYGNDIDISGFNIVRSDYFKYPSAITDNESISVNEEAIGIKYYANNDNFEAEELFDFKDILIGNTGSVTNSLNNQTQNNIQYLDSNGQQVSAIQGFREGNSGGYSNVTQLLCSEYLSLQTEPLEILQASVFSPDVSPLSLLKYSINNNSSYKYYTFLGGSFGAQSETMKGEWFKLDSSTPSQQPHVIDAHLRSLPEVNENQVDRLSSIESMVTNQNAIGLVNSIIVVNSTINKITFSDLTLCKVYDAQKLILRNPSNSEYVVVTVNGDKAIGVSTIDIASLVLPVSFPIGSTLSVLTYDLSNVITGGSSVAAPITVEVPLTAAQYNALHSQPFRLVQSPGVGKVVIPISVNIYARHTTTEVAQANIYVGHTPLGTSAGSFYGLLKRFMYNESGSRLYSLDSTNGETYQGDPSDKHFYIYSSAPLVGNIRPKVFFTYQIMNI